MKLPTSKNRTLTQTASRLGAVMIVRIFLAALLFQAAKPLTDLVPVFLTYPIQCAVYIAAFLIPGVILLGFPPKLSQCKDNAPKKSDWPFWLLMGLGINLSVTTIVVLSGLNTLAAQGVGALIPSSLLTHAWMLLFSVLWEELVFRWFFCGHLARYDRTLAVLVSAFLFAVTHGNIPQFVYSLSFGILAGYLYLESGHFLAPYLLHHGYNLFVRIFPRLVAFCIPGISDAGMGAAYLLLSFVLILLPLVFLTSKCRQQGRPTPLGQLRQVIFSIRSNTAQYKGVCGCGGMLAVYILLFISLFQNFMAYFSNQ